MDLGRLYLVNVIVLCTHALLISMMDPPSLVALEVTMFMKFHSRYSNYNVRSLLVVENQILYICGINLNFTSQVVRDYTKSLKLAEIISSCCF